MELKVWSEGIERVICGVTELTTCRDLVLALAQAAGKKGRYSLVEKWRDTERLVSPDEHPLVCLHKWGEYAGDVQFVLRHSGSRVRSGDKAGANRRTSTQITGHNFSPHLAESRSSSLTSLKKSLTFSGAHSRSILVEPRGSQDSSVPNTLSLESLTEHSSSQVSQDSSHFVNTSSSFYSSLEQSQRMRPQNSSASSSHSSASSLEPHSRHIQRPSQHGNIPFSYTPGGSVGSLERTRRRQTNTTVPADHHTSSRTSTQPPHRDINKPTNPAPTQLTSNLKSSSESNNNNVDSKPNANLSSTVFNKPAKQDNDKSLQMNGEDEVKRAEMIRLVNLQLEKMSQQESEMSRLQSEIANQESQPPAPNQRELLDQLAKLRICEEEQDSDIQELELVSWVDKLAMEQDKKLRLSSEIQTFKTCLEECRTELQKYYNKIEKLKQDIAEQREEQQQQEDHKKSEDQLVVQEVSDLHKQINSHLVSHEQKQTDVDKLQAEVKELESVILDKKTQVTSLEQQVKDSNLQSFSRSPTNWMRSSREGLSAFNRSSPSRPGSARRLDSPQRLKETVATAKNPHGLWV